MGRNELKLSYLSNYCFKTIPYKIGDSFEWINNIQGKVLFLDLAYLNGGIFSENFKKIKLHFSNLSKIKNQDFQYIYTSSIAVYGDQLSIKNITKKNQGNRHFRTYEFFKLMSEKLTEKKINNYSIWRLGHIVGPGSNYMKGLASNRFFFESEKMNKTFICFSMKIYYELIKILDGSNNPKYRIFTEMNSIGNTSIWNNLLSSRFGVFVVYENEKNVKPLVGIYPKFLESLSFLLKYFNNNLLIKLEKKLFKMYKNRYVPLSFKVIDNQRIESTESLSDREFSSIIDELLNWWYEYVEVKHI